MRGDLGEKRVVAKDRVAQRELNARQIIAEVREVEKGLGHGRNATSRRRRIPSRGCLTGIWADGTEIGPFGH